MHAWSAPPPSRGMVQCFVSLCLANKPAAERISALLLLHVCRRVAAKSLQQWGPANGAGNR